MYRERVARLATQYGWRQNAVTSSDSDESDLSSDLRANSAKRKTTIKNNNEHTDELLFEEAKRKAQHHGFLAEKENLMAQVRARHSQIVELVSLLQATVQSLDNNRENLELSIRETTKRYKQARASVNDLTSDQDALQRSLLTGIDTKLEVIHTLLEYFKTFTEDPCTVNKVASLAVNQGA